MTLAALRPRQDVGNSGDEMPCYGIRRIQAAVIADPELSDAEVTFLELSTTDPEEWLTKIAESRPDVVGFSVYVWSFPLFIDVARQLKKRLPQATIVFGGPSARPAMFQLHPYADALRFVDAISISEDGEAAIRDLVRLRDRSPASLRQVPNLAVPGLLGWSTTTRRPPADTLDTIASPFQLGLMPKGSFGYLETYRGCPMSCTFCEWGDTESPRLTFSAEYLTRELQALKDTGCAGAFLLDAGLNLNTRAFRNLVAAERAVQFFRTRSLICEMYPSHATEEHLEFLQQCAMSYLGVGLQSFDKALLKRLERPFDEEKFVRVVGELARIAPVELQVILGLPGDTPEGFKHTMRRALEFETQVRVYHCLVLPDALMTRGAPEYAMDYDPYTLKMRSCLGWSERDLLETHDWLSNLAVRLGGDPGHFWWFFPRPKERRTDREQTTSVETR